MFEKCLIEDFVDSVLLIDDKRNEVEGLIEQLSSQDISVVYLTPDEFNNRSFKKLRRIIFVDLKLYDERSVVDNIAKIRKLFETKFPVSLGGVYGVVLWTNHANEASLFEEKLSEDRKAGKYNTPLFIVSLDKSVYLSHGYEKCLSDLDDELRKNKAAYFFISWSISVQKATGLALSDMYALVSDYGKQELEMLYLLFIIAKNHTGVSRKMLTDNPGYSLAVDAYKAFNELLHADLANKLSVSDMDLFGSTDIANPWPNDYPKELNVYARLNSKAFIDTTNIAQTLVVPGNVYEITNAAIPDTCEFPKKSRKIMIELTPPCDFSNKKVLSRCVCGFMIECPADAIKQRSRVKVFTSGFRYILWPIWFDTKVYMICFDFRCLLSLKDNEITTGDRCKVLFKANPRLFADILQKFSSHAARLGVSDVKPTLPKHIE